MKTFSLIALLLLALTGLARAQNEALITKVQGRVTLNGKSARVAQRLTRGDKLEVPTGGLVTLVYLTDSHKETLTGPGFVKVGTGEHSGQLERQSGPGAISKVPSGNIGKAGVASVRAEYSYAALRRREDGKVEVVFSARPEFTGPLTLSAFPYNPETAGPSESAIADEVTASGPNQQDELIVLLPESVETGMPIRLLVSAPETATLGRWVVLLSPERADSLEFMRQWAFEEPLKLERLLSYCQIAYEWNDFSEALRAASQAYSIKKSESVRELYRKLLFLNQQEGEARNL
ncbi:hypothetical protein DYH09_16995 [bacterium CPR1]|nr:hypothetical protein [bacterium CPR1]